MTTKIVHVAAAVIHGEDQQVLLAKRLESAHQGGLWEFPGGKVETGETVSDALARELKEELDIDVLDSGPLIQIRHDYPDKSVLLDVWHVWRYAGDPRGVEGQVIEWVSKGALRERAFPAANVPILTAVELPSDYVVTPEVATAADVGLVLDRLKDNLRQGKQLIQLRQKSFSPEDSRPLVDRAVALCDEYGATLLVNSAMLSSGEECEEVYRGRYGIHLTEQALMACALKPIGYRYVAASCHGLAQLQHAERLGVDFVTVSPVQPTETHPESEHLGWERFTALVKQAKMPVFALGGMTEDNKADAVLRGAQGVAAIRAYL